MKLLTGKATSVPCDQAQVAISGAQLLLVRSVSGCCRCQWPAAFPGGGCLTVGLALFARKASMLVHACHLVLSSLRTRLGTFCSFHGFACWGISWRRPSLPDLRHPLRFSASTLPPRCVHRPNLAHVFGFPRLLTCLPCACMQVLW